MYNLAQTGHLSKKKRAGYAKKYFKKRLKAIHEVLPLQPADFTLEKVHEIRLEIKKIKALFSLISYTSKDFRKRKYFKEFKTLFDKAGDVRCIQIEQALLKKYIPENQDTYLNNLHKLELEKGKELQRLFQSDTASKFFTNKKRIISFLGAVTEKDVHNFLKKDAKKLVSLVERQIFSEQNLHVIRKKLKKFYFIAKTTYTHIVIPDPWNKLLELLGEWHDNQVAIEHLRKAIYFSQFNQAEIDRLYGVKQELVLNRETLFDQITSTYSVIENKENRIKVPHKIIK